jgi:hypothetical protein
MGQFSISHILIILLSIATWVGVAAVIIFTLRKIGLFGRRPK